MWRLEQVLQTGSDPGSRVAQGAVSNEDDPEVEADSIFDIVESPAGISQFADAIT